jgi:hypothetical protein
MRKVALDLGARKTAYCEVPDGKVVLRGTENEVRDFEARLGPEQPEAIVPKSESSTYFRACG